MDSSNVIAVKKESQDDKKPEFAVFEDIVIKV